MYIEAINLIEANIPQLMSFKRQIEKTGGVMSGLTHPYFLEDNPEKARFRRQPNYEASRAQFFTDHLQNDKPFVVFEQTSDIHLLRKRVGQFGEGRFYFVETQDHKSEFVDDQYSWGYLVEVFNEAGVRHLNLGGIYMQLQPAIEAIEQTGHPMIVNFIDSLKTLMKNPDPRMRWLDQELVPMGCAGMMMERFLLSGFTASLSPVSSPSYQSEPLDFWEYFQDPIRNSTTSPSRIS